MAELTAESGESDRVAVALSPGAAERPAYAWSIAAIASLACGIFLIVPYLSGLAAIALAILGLRQTAHGEMRGRRLAWAGMIFGLLNFVGWTAYFCIIADLSAGGRAAAHQFFADLNSPIPRQARRDCLGVSPERLDAASNDLKNWGGLKSVTV